MRDKTELIDAPERRGVALADFEIRATGAMLSLAGYASVFDAPYEVYGGPDVGGWIERVNRHAFDVTLKDKADVHLLVNHEGMPLARTKSGTLELSSDSKGLKVFAPNLDRRDPDVQRLEAKMSRGDMDEMSIGFRTKAHKWTNDDTERELLEVSLHKGDVSVVNHGANDRTSAQMNSIRQVFDYLADVEPERALAELRSGGDSLLAQLEQAREVLSTLRRSLAPEDVRRPKLEAARVVLAEV